MGIVSKIFTTVSGIYNTINPITFSGVNDVVVVKRKDGTYSCSPFQLRFSKIRFYNAKTQVVNLYVNNKLCDINMIITSQGDLLFEENNNILKTHAERIISYMPPEINPSDILNTQTIFQNLKPKIDITINDINNLKIEREKNISKRIFGLTFLTGTKNDIYYDLSLKYNKLSTLLSSSEHFSTLLDKYEILLETFNNIIKGFKSQIKFSLCLNGKIENTVKETFNSYLVTQIDHPDNTVVKIDANGKRIPFYFPYILFTRLFFELRDCKNKKRKLIEFLENEHNLALGWNIFGTKKPLKRDISFSMILTSEELLSLDLKFGKNDVIFKISGAATQLEGSIYLWKDTDKIVVSDIDGTITKSDIWGHLYGLMGRDWTQSGVAALFSRIVNNGYKILYLSSRPLSQSMFTKNYLNSVNQDNCSLPHGPVFLSPEGVFGAIYCEVISRTPHEFKNAVLSNLLELFGDQKPLVAGFGNKVTDVIAYKAVNIASNKIYTINPSGQLIAEYSKSLVGTYHTLSEFVESSFPVINKKKTADMYKYNDFNYWR